MLIGHMLFYSDRDFPRDFVLEFHSSFSPCVLHSISIVHKPNLRVKLQSLEHNTVNCSFYKFTWVTTLSYFTRLYIQFHKFQAQHFTFITSICDRDVSNWWLKSQFLVVRGKTYPFASPKRNETLYSSSSICFSCWMLSVSSLPAARLEWMGGIQILQILQESWIVQQKKPDGSHSSKNSRDRNTCQFIFCTIHYKIARWGFVQSSARSQSTGSHFNDKPGVVQFCTTLSIFSFEH